jgi:hypothetical protein
MRNCDGARDLMRAIVPSQAQKAACGVRAVRSHAPAKF